jgi:hypothetical protein
MVTGEPDRHCEQARAGQPNHIAKTFPPVAAPIGVDSELAGAATPSAGIAALSAGAIQSAAGRANRACPAATNGAGPGRREERDLLADVRLVIIEERIETDLALGQLAELRTWCSGTSCWSAI